MGNIFKILPHPAPFDRGVEGIARVHKSGGDFDRQGAVKAAFARGGVERDKVERFAGQMTRAHGLGSACRHQFFLFRHGAAGADDGEINTAEAKGMACHHLQARIKGTKLRLTAAAELK